MNQNTKNPNTRTHAAARAHLKTPHVSIHPRPPPPLAQKRTYIRHIWSIRHRTQHALTRAGPTHTHRHRPSPDHQPQRRLCASDPPFQVRHPPPLAHWARPTSLQRLLPSPPTLPRGCRREGRLGGRRAFQGSFRCRRQLAEAGGWGSLATVARCPPVRSCEGRAQMSCKNKARVGERRGRELGQA